MEVPLPNPEQLWPILRRAIELLNDKLAPELIRQMAAAFRRVRWELKDVDVTMYLVLDDAEPAIRFAPSIEGDPQMVIGMESATLHDAAWGRTSFGAAFISGKLKVKGLHPLKLTKFVPLLKPFLASYCEAEEEFCGPVQ